MRRRSPAARIGRSRPVPDLRTGGPLPSPNRTAGIAIVCGTALLLIARAAASGEPPAPADSASSPSASAGTVSDSAGSVFSSLKQAFSEDFKREVIRGHIDVDSSSGTHRFYCLVDARTGKPEDNGVAGEPYVRPDGMTGIRNGAVAPVSCPKAEQQGSLVTTGYTLKLKMQAQTPGVDTIAKAAPAPPPTSPTVALPAAPAASRPAAETSRTRSSPDRIDVAGIRLGMSPDQVRAVLRSRALANYLESTESLAMFGTTAGAGHGVSASRYVNEIAAWTSLGAASADAVSDDGESYEVMFTPVPGKERVMAVVHSVGYSPPRVLRTSALQGGLAAKYGAYDESGGSSASPTWHLQSDGVLVPGDACNRRGIFGGIAALEPHTPAARNLALKTTPDEFHYQIERCGLAVVTEDQAAATGDASTHDPAIVRYTVTAYSPSIAFEGATAAAQLIQTRTGADAGARGASQEAPTPSL